MNWWSIIKAPTIDMPEADKHFEWNPDYLEQTVKDWDRDNPAKVLHIEPPQSPDPSERMADGSIRFAPKGSKKFIQDSFKFITDRTIDNQSGLLNILREKGYFVTVKDSRWIKSHYGNKLNRITVPDEARAYLITVGAEIASAMRKKNPKKRARLPDKKRSAESIERWNDEHKEYKLDTLKGFKARVEEIVRELYPRGTSSAFQKYLRADAFNRNKHDLYLTQKALININWVKQNILKPIHNLEKKEMFAENARRIVREKQEEDKMYEKDMERYYSTKGSRYYKKPKKTQKLNLRRNRMKGE